METQKHIEGLLHPQPPPVAQKKPGRVRSVSKVTSTLSNCTSSVSVKVTKPPVRKPRENSKVVRKAVRFATTPTVHIFEEEETFGEDEEDVAVTSVSQSATEGSKNEAVKDEEEVFCEVASKVVAIDGAVQKMTPL